MFVFVGFWAVRSAIMVAIAVSRGLWSIVVLFDDGSRVQEFVHACD